jgi:hypothetical protein
MFRTTGLMRHRFSVEVMFTSGATESNNLTLLGLREHGVKTGRKHIVETAIEHKAVLELLECLATHGFAVTLVKPETDTCPDEGYRTSCTATLANNDDGIHSGPRQALAELLMTCKPKRISAPAKSTRARWQEFRVVFSANQR